MNKIKGLTSSRKGAIIFGVVIVVALGGLIGQRIYKTKVAAKVAATQAAKEAAEINKKREAYAKQKADAEAKALADAKALEATRAAEEEAQVVKSNAEIYRVGRPVAVVYEEMHTMINSVVIADDVWEKKIITKENVTALITEVKNSKYNDEKLLEILNRWKDGDFTQGDSDHNYLWDKLGGTTGRATGVNTSKLPIWAKK